MRRTILFCRRTAYTPDRNTLIFWFLSANVDLRIYSTNLPFSPSVGIPAISRFFLLC